MVFPPTVDYTSKDRASLQSRLVSLVDNAFPAWSERARANFGNILLAAVPWVGDVFTFYLDKFARESRWSLAQLRRSLLGLVKLIDYQVRGPGAATVDLTFTLDEAAVGSVTLLAGQRIRSKRITEPVAFQLLADLVLPAGDVTATASAENSQTQVQNFVSTELPLQKWALTVAPLVRIDSFEAANGTFTQVDNFLDSDSSERHFVLTTDDAERGTLQTGDGTNGVIPIGSVEITYTTGGGPEGNVEPGSLEVLDGPFTDEFGNPVQISVTHTDQASGGEPRQSNADIRLQAPRALRVLERAVAREDYEIVAEAVSGVARALHLTRNEDEGVAENAGILFVIPTGGGTPSTALLEAVEAEFEFDGSHPHFNTYQLRAQAPSYQLIDHSITAYKAEDVTPAQLKTAITEALAEFYSVEIAADRLIVIAPKAAAALNITAADGSSLIQNPLVNFGFYFKDADGNPSNEMAWSDVFNLVRDLDQVRKLDASTGLLLDGERADVAIGSFGFPQLGDVIIRDGDTGAVL
jgi:hypothetical protein